MNGILFRDVRLLDLAAPKGMTSICALRTKNGRIHEIAPTLVPNAGEDVIEGNGNLLMPGLINGHFHSSVTHMKGRLPGLPLEIFMLYECPELEVLRPTPREAYLRTMLGCIEMLKTGTTAVQDDCFFVPEPEPEIIDAVMQAYTDSGIRARVALDQPELSELEKLPYLTEMLPDDQRRQMSLPSRTKSQTLLALYDHLINRWHGTADGRIKAAVSCSAPQRVSPGYFSALDDLSQRHDLPHYAHMLETKLQRVFGEECLNGRSLVQYTKDLGLLSDRMNIIHSIWVDDKDLDLIAASGASIAHNPISNLRLGSGVMPFRAIRDRGIPVCLGVDEAIADDAINMWSVMKTAGMIHNLSGWDYENWPSATEILTAATVGGGHAMREPGLGSMALGAPADLVLLNLKTLPFTPLNNLQRQLVHCELGTSVLAVMVSGRLVVQENRLIHVDEESLVGEARMLFEEKSDAFERADKAVSKLLPHYRRMYHKAATVDVGMERRLEVFTRDKAIL
ncbi:amidohydrolase family protein [Pseudoruegeria sp. SK021]|uniref:amidohydrolase family protein n=1 Tax=Pseudoruegeria sp. SK021 TaxID=1933035 RepID=UPI000A25747D|nr:amidohydrolase family protein [Pseudoruegeria sp. SK021]OSP53408.1 amidohydrolase [Pseudoruegeria sp. SK021]